MTILLCTAAWLLCGFVAFRVRVFQTKGIKTYAGYKQVEVYQAQTAHRPARMVYEKQLVPPVYYSPRDGLLWLLGGGVVLVIMLGMLLVTAFFAFLGLIGRGLNHVHRFLTSDGFNTSPVVNKIFGLK